jgi:hypothetical protein
MLKPTQNSSYQSNVPAEFLIVNSLRLVSLTGRNRTDLIPSRLVLEDSTFAGTGLHEPDSLQSELPFSKPFSKISWAHIVVEKNTMKMAVSVILEKLLKIFLLFELVVVFIFNIKMYYI